MQAVNILGIVTAGLCAFLLLRGYFAGRKRLLLWSGLCFAGLAVSNTVLFVDLLIPPANLYAWRLGLAALSILFLLYGLIFESD